MLERPKDQQAAAYQTETLPLVVLAERFEMSLSSEQFENLHRAITESEAARESGEIEPASRRDVCELCKALKSVRMLRYLLLDDSQEHKELMNRPSAAAIDPDDGSFDDSAEGWDLLTRNAKREKSRLMNEAIERINNHRVSLTTRWTAAEPIAVRVVEAASREDCDGYKVIADGCATARLLAMNVFAEVDAKQLDDAVTALGHFRSKIKVTATKRRKRKSPLMRRAVVMTAIECNTMRVVGDHCHNFAAAAEKLGKDPKTVRENYDRAQKKLARISGRQSRSVGASQFPTDKRGQPTV